MAHIFNHRRNLPDFRDLAVPQFEVVSEEAIPKKYDLWDHVPDFGRWDQGQEGSCGGHAEARCVQVAEIQSGTEFKKGDRVSPAFAYWAARKLQGTTDQDSGVDNRSLFQGLRQYGWVHETDMPYVAGDYATAPSEQAVNDATKYEGTTYKLLHPGNGMLRLTLAGGVPFVIGFVVPDYFEESSEWDPAKDYLRLPSQVPGFGKFIGGHDVAVTGFDYSLTQYDVPVFLIDNSWGADWGMKGRFAMDARWFSASQAGERLIFDATAITKIG